MPVFCFVCAPCTTLIPFLAPTTSLPSSRRGTFDHHFGNVSTLCQGSTLARRLIKHRSLIASLSGGEAAHPEQAGKSAGASPTQSSTSSTATPQPLVSSQSASIQQSNEHLLSSSNFKERLFTLFTRPIAALRVLWSFSRPHTVYGSVASILSMTALAARAGSSQVALQSLLTALPPAILINIYIVGLNQLCDVEIDSINKPYLPLAAGSLSVPDARKIVLASLAAGLAYCFAPAATPALRGVLVGSALLGTVYSSPPIRLKRFPFLASFCILSVRGALINSCFFLHAAGITSLNPMTLPPLISFSCIFFMIFGVVIALLKDVPDIRGDTIFNVRTLTVRLGASSVFRLCQNLLSVMYALAAIATWRLSPSRLFASLNAAVHIIICAWLLILGRKVDPQDADKVYNYYMTVWKAFYLEYALLPLASF